MPVRSRRDYYPLSRFDQCKLSRCTETTGSQIVVAGLFFEIDYKIHILLKLLFIQFWVESDQKLIFDP